MKLVESVNLLAQSSSHTNTLALLEIVRIGLESIPDTGDQLGSHIGQALEHVIRARAIQLSRP